MFPTEMPLTEPTVAYDPLRTLFAVLEGASLLLGWHAAQEGESHLQSGGEGEGGDCLVLGRWVGEVFARVYEAECGWWS